MLIRDGIAKLESNLNRQLDHYWEGIDFSNIKRNLPIAVEQLEGVFNELARTNRYIWENEKSIFSPMHSVQYSVFLYFLSHALYASENIKEAEAIYYLNKIMHSCDWFYGIELPEVFFAEHPLGSVLGKAKYGNRFFFYQGCTVGGNRDKRGNLVYPVIGEKVLMYANSSIIGRCCVGNNVIISAGTQVINQDIPSDSIVYGMSPRLNINIVGSDEIGARQSHIWEMKL